MGASPEEAREVDEPRAMCARLFPFLAMGIAIPPAEKSGEAFGSRQAAYRSLPSHKAQPLSPLPAGREKNAQDAVGRGGVSSKPCANPLHLACRDPKNACAANACGCHFA